MSALAGISCSLVPFHHGELSRDGLSKAHAAQADPTPTAQNDPTSTLQNDPQPSNPSPPASGFTSIGHELDPTAPLWRVYRDEVRTHDRDVTLDEWNKTLDVLLIFAGLFSAVITSFLVASYPLLNPEDENEDVVNAIRALAMAINSSITLPAPKPQEPITASILWVNGLWFASLFIALAVAFFAILAKQWLVEYNHRMADPPAAVGASSTARNDHATVAPPAATADAEAPNLALASNAQLPTASLAWARRRQFFFDAFDDWHIPALITQVLPFLLHVALFLFLVGLSVFVWTLNKRIARGMTALTALLFGLYLIATFLPVLWVECPTATPLIRRIREIPTWLAIKAVQLWSLVLPLVPSSGVDEILVHLRQRQESIRNSVWLGSAATDGEVKFDALRWLIMVSGTDTAITAAFQALGALPRDSKLLPSLRNITAGMDTGVERLGNSLSPPTAVEIIRAVRTELVLGRGYWDLPLLGLDLSSSLTKTLKESQHPEARLLSAAMHLDGTTYRKGAYAQVRSFSIQVRSFSSLYDSIDTILRGNGSSDSCRSTVRLLLDRPGISVPAFACLIVLLARSLPLDDSDKALIFRVLNLLPRYKNCNVYDKPHICDGLCVVFFVVRKLDMEDPASRRIVPIILSHLLPCLMPELKSGSEDRVPLSIYRDLYFFRVIIFSDWLHSPPPAGNTDVDVLSILLSRFDWSYDLARDAHVRILEWFMFRGLYRMLRSPSLITKVQDIQTCEADERPSMLLVLCSIVHRIKAHPNVTLTTDDNTSLDAFFSSLISLCRELLPCCNEESLGVLFEELIPELGACIKRMLSNQYVKFFDMVDAALGSLDGQVENKEEYLLHVAQHCVGLNPKWTQRDAVRAHLDPPQLEKRLVEQGPCTKCTEGSADKWSAWYPQYRHPTSSSDAQDPQPGLSALPLPATPPTSLAASAPAVLLLTAYHPDVAPASSTPNALSAFHVESGTIPNLPAATGSGPSAPSVGSHPVIASLSVPPGYSVLVSASNSPAVLDPPSGTTPSLVMVPSAPTTATLTVPTRVDVCAAEVSPVTVLDDNGTLVVSQPEPVTRGDAHLVHDPPSAAESVRVSFHWLPFLNIS
ncbi:hypothetical protein EXIGLDRAFT_766350 [Exidia glandulosa HHB12029]|uniref:DUF6535 domain-containing protein n=1 Tax=Exidia glandulosa HHB12029 TaxID=1314781 RepID=A0A165JU53_EXIGL|nr:hypothetical protein EXIGLDRAFT_766350 [Exidia glandulosa HHB12029]